MLASLSAGVGQVVLGDLVEISRSELVEVPDISCSDVNSDDDHAADDDLISPSDNATRVKVGNKCSSLLSVHLILQVCITKKLTKITKKPKK